MSWGGSRWKASSVLFLGAEGQHGGLIFRESLDGAAPAVGQEHRVENIPCRLRFYDYFLSGCKQRKAIFCKGSNKAANLCNLPKNF